MDSIQIQKSHFKEIHITRQELKEKLNKISKENREILDVFFYKEKNDTMIVIPYIIRYKSISPTMDVVKFDTAEKALIYFYDHERLGTVSIDPDTEENISAKQIENL